MLAVAAGSGAYYQSKREKPILIQTEKVARRNLTEIVIGPQGVFEMATATGTHEDLWLGVPPTGLPVTFGVAILFPWDASAGLFTGEKMWHQVIGGPPTGWGSPQTRT